MAKAPVPGLPSRFDLLDFLFNAAGRTRRSHFIVGLVGLFASDLALTYGLTVAGAPEALLDVIAFFFFWFNGVITARRLHDVGLSGWWYAPFSGLAWLWAASLAGPVWVFWLLSAPVAIASLFMLVWPGDLRLNRFGPPPA